MTCNAMKVKIMQNKALFLSSEYNGRRLFTIVSNDRTGERYSYHMICNILGLASFETCNCDECVPSDD